MSRRIAILAVTLLPAILPLGLTAAPQPVNSDAVTGARAVLEYLYSVRDSGHTLAGQHVYPATDYSELEHVRKLTGDYPAVAEFDLLGFHANPARKRLFFERIRRHAARGGLIGISWHETSPALATLDEGGYAHGTKMRMGQEDFEKVLTPGTELHRRWLEHLDLAAGWLKELRDDGIVVLWRPYHEMTGPWFWWGAKEPGSFRRLWTTMYDRFTNHHGLNNLLWVWSAAQAGDDFTAYCPLGHVDIGGVDIYQRQRTAPAFVELCRKADRASGDKPVALTEVGLLPEPETFVEETDCVWFVLWGRGFLDQEHYRPPGDKEGNDPKNVQAFYAHPAVLTLGEMRQQREKATD